jgi:hypothetical protein
MFSVTYHFSVLVNITSCLIEMIAPVILKFIITILWLEINITKNRIVLGSDPMKDCFWPAILSNYYRLVVYNKILRT